MNVRRWVHNEDAMVWAHASDDAAQTQTYVEFEDFTAERTAREAAEATSEGRRVALLEKAEEARREWQRAEAAEAELARLKLEAKCTEEMAQQLIDAHERLRGEIERLADEWRDDDPSYADELRGLLGGVGGGNA